MFISLADFTSKYHQLLGLHEVKEQTQWLLTQHGSRSGVRIEKLLTAMSYKVLKAQPKTLNKAKITIA